MGTFVFLVVLGKTYCLLVCSYTLLPSTELFALGVSNVVASFFLCMPSTGSFTRSAVSADSGARTAIALLVTGCFALLVLLFLAPLLEALPKAVLAAIVVTGAIGLLDKREFQWLWHTCRRDFFLWSVSFLVTILAGVEVGILSGMGVAIAVLLYDIMRPRVSVYHSAFSTFGMN